MQDQAAALRVVELFAGVGGFRLALEGEPGSVPGGYRVVWSNQYEPSTCVQHASLVYQSRWPDTAHSNEDISTVVADAKRLDAIMQPQPDVLAAGFPCQDYSVAKPLSQSRGLEGKKGLLWWCIHAILEHAISRGAAIKYLLLENVDRLVQSPASCRGRDFAVILASLAQLGYATEWRVINAAEYGFPQRRRRLYMVAYHCSSPAYARLERSLRDVGPEAWMNNEGLFASAFPARPFPSKSGAALTSLLLPDEPFDAQSAYQPSSGGRSCFANAGLMLPGTVWTTQVRAAAPSDLTPFAGRREPQTLGDIVHATPHVPAGYYLDEAVLPRWAYLKGAKRALRERADGTTYRYSEGALAFPDALDAPSRTIITSEGGAAPSRTTHVVCDATGRLRRLTPEELEALNGFPRGFTSHPSISPNRRAFFMGNALVVGIVRIIGRTLHDLHSGTKLQQESTVPSRQETAPSASVCACPRTPHPLKVA